MSIQSEITRITQKRDASLTAVSGKGVTVPSGSTIDDLPDLIDLIVVEPTYSVSKTLSNVTSSNDDTKVIAGGSFYADLTPTNGYSITNVTVTMGGVDVTEQVFKPGVGGKGITANGVYSASDDALSGYDRVVVNVAPNLGTKSITANGTYAATSDSLDGYSSVTVNVPTGGDAPELQSKTATYTPTTSTQTETIIADTGYDGLSSVGVTVNPIPSEYVVPSGTKSITENGVGIDVSAYATVDVAVSSGGGPLYATGTYTPAETYAASGNHAITNVSEIGFTPTRFVFYPNPDADNKALISGIRYAIIYELFDEAWPLKIITRYSNTTNTSSSSPYQSSWTTQTNGCLYLSNDTIYVRTTSAFILVENVEYIWEAYK